MTDAAREVAAAAWRGGALLPGRRTVPEEVPVAIAYDGATFAVMLASPADLADFAVGFSLTEGVIGGADEIEDLAIVPAPRGIVARVALRPAARAVLDLRRRRLVGAAGCGLCGVESLEEAWRDPRAVPAGGALPAASLSAAVARMAAGQALGAATRASHAAGFLMADGAVLVREDIGRHNALDKLLGALARQGGSARGGAVLVSSRVSLELVQKAMVAGAAILAGVSAPSAGAIACAAASGMTLVAVARDDGFEVFTHPHRILT